jgi:uncharacterized membrane protein
MTETVRTGISENSLGALSYLTLIPAILFLAIAPYNRNANVRFHAWQSIIVGAVAFLINFALGSLAQSTSYVTASVFITLSALIGVAYVLVIIVCAVRALNGKRTMLPLFGAWAERQANK